MCGIAGIVALDGAPVEFELVKRMTATIAHRGPDDLGYFMAPGVGFGHRRLSIIDVQGGAQPMFSEDGSVSVVFNGEIYNHPGLIRDLASRGHAFRSRSDSEAIVHAYEEYGDECVRHFRGMFGFALWDARNKRALLARDRLGKKPVYYHANARRLAFASEIKALLELPDVARELDPEALDLYLSLRYVPGPRTMFQGIAKLQPGCTLTVENGAVEERQYWDLEFGQTAARSDAELAAEFEALLADSVRMRLISEVPLGVFLSGGIDSTSIVSFMKKVAGDNPIRTFSIGYESDAEGVDGSDELAYARTAAEAFGTDHHEFRLSPAGFRDAIPRLVWHLDEPIADPSCIPLFFIAQLAREHVTVVLSGEGADEVLAGYGIYQRMLLMEGAYAALSPLSRWFAPHVARLAPGSLQRHYVSLLGFPLERRYRGVSRGVEPELKNRLLGMPPQGGESAAMGRLFARYFEKVRNVPALDRLLYVDTKVWLPDDLLMKADKMTMATALELRVPFLDHRVVEFAAKLPGHLKLHKGRGKALLRQVVRDRIPETILNRPKKGFPVPTEAWLRGPMAGFVRDMLLVPGSACSTHMDAGAVRQIVSEHESGRANRHQELWTLLVFEFWHRLFLAPRPAAP